jgi:hypothetical protein
MANQWIEFVRKWSKNHNISYACAISQPQCKQEYREKYGNRKKLSQTKEREMMGAEDKDSREEFDIIPKKNSKGLEKPKKKIELKKDNLVLTQKELSKMTPESIAVANDESFEIIPKKKPKAKKSESIAASKETNDESNFKVGDVLEFEYNNEYIPFSTTYKEKIVRIGKKSFTTVNEIDRKQVYFNIPLSFIRNNGKIPFKIIEDTEENAIKYNLKFTNNPEKEVMERFRKSSDEVARDFKKWDRITIQQSQTKTKKLFDIVKDAKNYKEVLKILDNAVSKAGSNNEKRDFNILRFQILGAMEKFGLKK